MTPKEYGQQPAFPIETDYKIANGITRREWFAGIVAQGLWSNADLVARISEMRPGAPSKDVMAEYAFNCADAMIAASLE